MGEAVATVGVSLTGWARRSRYRVLVGLVLLELAACASGAEYKPDGLGPMFEQGDAQLAKRLAEDLYLRASQARDRARVLAADSDTVAAEHARQEALLWLQAAVAEASRVQAEQARAALSAEWLRESDRATALRLELAEIRAAARAAESRQDFARRLAEAHGTVGLHLPDAGRFLDRDAAEVDASRRRVAETLLAQARLLLGAARAGAAMTEPSERGAGTTDAAQAGSTEPSPPVAGPFAKLVSTAPAEGMVEGMAEGMAEALAQASAALDQARRHLAGEALPALLTAQAALAAAERALGAFRSSVSPVPTEAERRSFSEEAAHRGLSVRFDASGAIVELPAPVAAVRPGLHAVTVDLHTLAQADALLRLHPHGAVRIELHVPPKPPLVPPPALRARARRALRTLADHRLRVSLVPKVVPSPGEAGLRLVLPAYAVDSDSP